MAKYHVNYIKKLDSSPSLDEETMLTWSPQFMHAEIKSQDCMQGKERSEDYNQTEK